MLPLLPVACAPPQVAERSLFLWNNEYIVNMVAQYRSQVLPIVFGALEENAANHWNPAVHGLTCNVRRMFQVGPGCGAAGCEGGWVAEWGGWCQVMSNVQGTCQSTEQAGPGHRG